MLQVTITNIDIEQKLENNCVCDETADKRRLSTKLVKKHTHALWEKYPMSALVQTEHMQIANELHAVQDVETDTAHTGTNMNPIDTVEKKKEKVIAVQFGMIHQLQTEKMRKVITISILQKL